MSSTLSGVKLTTTDLTVDTTTLVTDSANNRVGVGTATPATALDVVGTITADGLTVDGTTTLAGATTTADINFGDDDKAVFGDGSDLQIYHDGSHSYVQDTNAGNLYLKSNGAEITLRDGSNTSMIRAFTGGGVRLFNNGTERLEATATGVDVTGTVTADGVDVSGDITGGNVMRIHSTDSTRGSIQISAPNEGTNRQVSFGNNFYLSGTSTFSQDSTAIGGSAIVMSAPNSNYGEFLFKAKQDSGVGGAVCDRMLIASNGDISFYEDTGTTAKFFWDASEEQLSIAGNVSGIVPFTTYSGGYTAEYNSYSAEAGFQLMSYQSDAGSPFTKTSDLIANADGTVPAEMRFLTKANGASNPTEAMRIDSSGNLLVGMTTSSGSTEGVRATAVGTITATRSGSASQSVAVFNKLDNDGIIVDLKKAGVSVGTINADTGYINIGSGDTRLAFIDGGSWKRVIPRTGSNSASDNIVDLGDTGSRFDDIYATNGTIQTSDEREKQDIAVLSDAEQRVAVACKGLLRKFRWKDAVAEKGDDARIHFGIIAQDLQAAFEAEGLDAGDYAMFIHTTWWEHSVEVPAVEAQEAVYETQVDEEGNETQVLVSEAVEAKEAYTRTDHYDTAEEAPEGAVERDRMGVRYPELLAFIIASI